MSVVHRRRHRCCCCRRKLFPFLSSSPESMDQYQPNLAQSPLRSRGFKYVQMNDQVLFQKGNNHEIAKIHWGNLLLQYHLTLSTILGTKKKNLWLKGIQVCSNEGPRFFPRGDNYEIAKIHWQNLKEIFCTTTGPISTKLSTNIIIGWKGLKFVQIKGHALFLEEIITN